MDKDSVDSNSSPQAGGSVFKRTWSFTIILSILGTVLAAFGARPASESGLVATSASPFARLHDVPIRAVTLEDGFWRPRLDANRLQSIPALDRQLEEHGVIDNFRRLSGGKQASRRGYLFTDSDLFKWMEAAALTLQSADDAVLRARLEAIIDDVLAAQGSDGYLNTYHTQRDSIPRFSNFRDNHELYCLGHLIQAGIAYYRGSGQRRLLDGAIRYADYVLSLFGPGKRQCFSGHPEIEMALVELYRTTGEKKYLDFVRYLFTGVNLGQLGQPVSVADLRYAFSGLPFSERRELRSHAVRAMYACCGATDYYLETGDPTFWNTLQLLWRDMTSAKIYVTGGVGSRYDGEAFGLPWELPNERAYTETCAAIGAMMWNWRLLQATGEAVYADLFERGLYNGFVAGVSLSGCEYFYRNPLTSYGDNERKPWYNCTCCPPNVERTLAALPGYFYSTSAEGIWMHLFHSSALNWRLENGVPVKIVQQTRYPWEGVVEVAVEPARRTEFTLFVRIPDWTPETRITVDGAEWRDGLQPGHYCAIKRIWRKGDHLRLEFAMPVRPVYANPRAREDYRSVALMRGPLVYCLESIDQPDFSIFDAAVNEEQLGTFAPVPADGLNGVTALQGRGKLFQPELSVSPLYRYDEPPTAGGEVTLKAIPYYAWANRGKSEMEVWIPLQR